MKIVLFGATGMVGAGTLLECFDDPQVEQVVAIVRRPTGRTHEKFVEIIHDDFMDYSAIEDRLRGYDACLFCLGIPSSGLNEQQYREVTRDIAVAAGETLVRLNPQMRMCFVSGAGTNETGRQMWARVKAEAENAMLALPWKSAHMFRPAGIEPRRGVKSGVTSYRVMYAMIGWTLPALRKVAPGLVTTTEILGRALIRVGRDGHAKAILESADINEAGR